MKKTLILFLVFFACFLQNNIYGQDVIISLKKEPMTIKNSSFYIEDIIDARTNKNDIGFAKVGLFNTKTPVKFEKDFKQELFEYLNFVFPQQENQIPIILKINLLRVSERTGLTAEYAIAEIKVSFWLKKNNQLGKIYEAEATYEIPSKLDVTKYHESNIRVVLEQCFEKFIKSQWQDVSPVYEDYQIASTQISPSDTTITSSPNIGNLRQVILIGAIKGVNATGGNISYYRYFDKSEGWIIPWSMTGNFLKVKNKSKNIEGSFSNFGVSINGFKRIDRTDAVIHLQGMIPFGSETIDYGYKKETNFFLGVQLSQDIFYIPKSEYGIIASAGIYENLLANCNLYPKDVGFRVQLGCQFK